MKRFFSCLTLVSLTLLLLISVTKQTYAQTQQINTSNYISADTNPDVPQNIHSLTQVVASEVMSTMICQLSGIDILNHNTSCLGIDPQTHKIGFVPNKGGLLGLMTRGIQYTFMIPVHTGTYTHYMADKFGIASHAYAQNTTGTNTAAGGANANGGVGFVAGGVGFVGLEPLLNIWISFRDIVYLLFVVVFVIIGIAIMLRVQIDPRTVMTLENQLPKIVIAILFVTFSYAIAGFMIDMMWLVTFFVVNIVAHLDTNASVVGGQNLTAVATTNLLQGPLGYLGAVFNSNGAGGLLDVAGSGAHALADVLGNVFSSTNAQKLGIITDTGGGQQATSSCTSPQGIFDIVTWAFNPAGLLTDGCVNGLFQQATNLSLVQIISGFFAWILGSLGGLIILIALLITMFRVWFSLLQAYAFIVLDVILAPFYIIAGLIPGSSIGFGSWLRGIVSNLLAFPTTVFMFVLARVLLDAFYGNAVTNVSGNTVAGGSLFEPPLIGSFQGNGVNNPIGAFIALAIIFATPEVLNVVRKALQYEASPFGAAAMRHVGAGPASARRVGGGATAFFSNPLSSGPGQRWVRLAQSLFG